METKAIMECDGKTKTVEIKSYNFIRDIAIEITGMNLYKSLCQIGAGFQERAMKNFNIEIEDATGNVLQSLKKSALAYLRLNESDGTETCLIQAC